MSSQQIKITVSEELAKRIAELSEAGSLGDSKSAVCSKLVEIALDSLENSPQKSPDRAPDSGTGISPKIERLLTSIEGRLSALDSPISDMKKIELEREYLSLVSAVASTRREAEVIIEGIKTSLSNLQSFNQDLMAPIEQTRVAYSEMGEKLAESLDKFRASVDVFVDTSIQRYEDATTNQLEQIRSVQNGRIGARRDQWNLDRFLWLGAISFLALVVGYLAFQVVPENRELSGFRSDALREIREVQQMVCVDTRQFGAESLQRLREKVSCR